MNRPVSLLCGRGGRNRICDLMLPKQPRCQLRYAPNFPNESGWCPKRASNSHDFRPRLLRPVRLPIPPSGHSISVVSSRDSSACAPTSASLHMVGSRPCTSLQAAGAVGLWRCCKGTPEMEQQEGFDPPASTLATLRSTWLSYGCMFLRIVGPPVRGAIRGKFLKSVHRRRPAGEFTAARSLQWRPATGAVRGRWCEKNKKARIHFGIRASDERAWKVCAYALPPPGCG